MPDIRPLTLAARNLVANSLRLYPPEISEHTFTNLFIWLPSRPVFLAEIESSLVFLVEAAGATGKHLLFGPPLGPAPLSAVFDAFGEKISGAVRIPDRVAAGLPAAGFTAVPDRASSDYVYRVADLAELAGRRYAKKRNQVKKCLAAHRCEYVAITPELIAECEAMQDHWCHTRECGRNPGLCNEANAVAETFAHFQEFSLLGGAVRVDGTIRAYAMAETLSPGTAVWHFEKAMADVPGLGQLINQWFARYGLGSFTFVNREQDLGIPGLRQAKESYYPAHLVGKNSVVRAGAGPVTTKSIKAAGCAAEED
jgi:hypothetical protein